MITHFVSYQLIPGLFISVLLLAFLVLREFALASTDPRWNRISCCLVVPIVPLFVLFLVLAAARFEAFDSPDEFRGNIIPMLDLSTLVGENPTPTPYQPDRSEPTPVPVTPTQLLPNRPKKIQLLPLQPGSTEIPQTQLPPSVPLVTGIPVPAQAPTWLGPFLEGIQPYREYPYWHIRDTPY